MPYMTFEEFECPCCSENLIKKELVERLEEARKRAGVPFSINSGYRCPKHNKAIGGSTASAHMLGVAADIHIKGSVERFLIVEALLEAGFKRIGQYKTFVHADLSTDHPSPRMWYG